MRIQHLINETQSQEQLDELDMSGLASKTVSVVGKTAQGIGAVAGGVKGAWDAAKAGFQSGKNFVGGQRIGGAPTSTQQINQQGPQGTAPAQNVQGQAGTAVQQMAKATKGQKPGQIGNALYSQLKGQVGNLDKSSIDKMINLLQKQKSQAGKAQPGQGGQQSGALGQMANALTGGGQQAPTQPNTMANAPVSKTNVANPNNPNAQQQATPPADQPAATTPPAQTPPATPPAGQTAPTAPSAVDKKAMKNQYKADVAAATAAAQKPGFQQDATDKLAQKKVNIGDGPKINAYGKQYEDFEFESKFLGRMI
jgi:hypothetical protein